MREKKRFSLSLYTDDPIQREAWEILQACPNGQRTAMICRALCRMHDETYMLDELRGLLKGMSLIATEERVEPQQKKADTVDQNVMDFISFLQNGEIESFM